MTLPVSIKLADLFSLGSARLTAALLGLVTTAIIARSLTPEEIGVFSIVMSSCAFVTIAGECGMWSVALSEGARRGDVSDVFRPYLTCRLFLSSISIAAFLVLVTCLYPEYLAVTIPVLSVTLIMPLHMDWVLLANNSYRAASWVTASRSIFYCVLVAILGYSAGLTLQRLSNIVALSWCLAVGLSWLIIWGMKIGYRSKGTTPKVTKRTLVSLGWPVLGSALIAHLMMSADLLWIGGTIGKAGAGTYYLASAVITAGLILANAMNQLALSRYGPLSVNQEKFTSRLRGDIILVTFISAILAAGVILVLPRLIVYIFGSAYQGSADLILFLAPYLVAYHVYTLLSACCISLGVQRVVLRGLSVMIAVIPLFLTLASLTGNLASFAYAKCAFFVLATVFQVRALPREYRSSLWKPLAAPAVLILLLLILSASRFKLCRVPEEPHSYASCRDAVELLHGEKGHLPSRTCNKLEKVGG